MQDNLTKLCNGCGEEKPLSSFSRHKSGRYGRRAVCKECKHEEYQRNREAVREQQRAYYQANREKLIAQVCQRQQEHREQRRAYFKQYYAENRQRRLEQMTEYRKANAEAHRHSARQRRDKIRGAEGAHTIADIRAKHEEQGGKCYWCGDPLNGVYHVDHVIPISKGGGNGPGNICCACPACNLSKSDKMPWEFSDRLF